MEDKIIGFADTALSIKRIECLIEEMLFQQILSRESDLKKVNDKFTRSLENVDANMKKYAESLPPAPASDNSGDISIL